MAQTEVIIFKADVKEVQKALDDLNKKAQSIGKGTNLNLGLGGGSTGGVSGITKALGGAGGIGGISNLAKTAAASLTAMLGPIGLVVAGIGLIGGAVYLAYEKVKEFSKGVAKLGVELVGATYTGLKQFSEGLTGISSALRDSIKQEYLRNTFGRLSTELNIASGGLFGFNEQLAILKNAKGLTPEAIKSVANFGLALGMINGELNEGDTTKKLFEFISLGKTKGLDNIFGGEVTKKELDNLNKITSKRERINWLTKVQKRLSEEAGSVLNNPTTKLLRVVEFLNFNLQSVLQKFKAIDGIVSGLIEPAMVGFKAGGALGIGFAGNLLGGAAGLAITGMLLAGLNKLGIGKANKEEETKTKISGGRGLLDSIIGGVGNFLINDEEKIKFQFNEDDIKNFGTTAEELAKSSFLNRLSRAFVLLKAFLKGFIEGVEGTLDSFGILKTLDKPITEELKSKVAGFGIRLGATVTQLFSSLTKFFENILKQLPKLFETFLKLMEQVPGFDKRDFHNLYPSIYGNDEAARRIQQELPYGLNTRNSVNNILNQPQSYDSRLVESANKSRESMEVLDQIRRENTEQLKKQVPQIPESLKPLTPQEKLETDSFNIKVQDKPKENALNERFVGAMEKLAANFERALIKGSLNKGLA